jgi:hypothetical protein
MSIFWNDFLAKRLFFYTFCSKDGRPAHVPTPMLNRTLNTMNLALPPCFACFRPPFNNFC